MPYQEPIPRAIRLVHIQNLLYRNPRGLSCADLARACAVTVRSIQRDLTDLGLPPYSIPVYEESRRWHLSPDYQPQLSALQLTLPEATALFLAARLLLRASDEANLYVIAALSRLAAVLPDPIAGHVRASLTDVAPRAASDDFVRVFATVTAAWATARKVRLWHQSGASSNVHEYLLSPYFIEPSAPSYAAYVIGHEETFFHAVRTFKLERIQRAELTDLTFVIPTDFSITDFLSSAWGIMGGQQTQEVILRFAPEVTRRVKESHWHPAQSIADLPGGGCVLTVPVSHTIEMLPWIRGWGPAVEVLAPVELRQRISQDAAGQAALYASSPATAPTVTSQSAEATHE